MLQKIAYLLFKSLLIDNTGKSNSSEIEVVVPTTTSSGLKYADFAVGDGILPSRWAKSNC